MPVKKSVRLVDDTIAVCKNLTAEGRLVNWSGSLNAMAKQFTTLISEAMPEMQDKQWRALYCVFNGYMPRGDIKEEARLLHWRISEGYQYDEQVRELLGDEQQAIGFIEVVKKMTLSQRIAIIYKARSFWRQGPIATD